MNFKNLIQRYKNIFESNLDEFYIDGPKNMVETSNFVMSAKGKRVRPILSMMSCSSLGGGIKDCIDDASTIWSTNKANTITSETNNCNRNILSFVIKFF